MVDGDDYGIAVVGSWEPHNFVTLEIKSLKPGDCFRYNQQSYTIINRNSRYINVAAFLDVHLDAQLAVDNQFQIHAFHPDIIVSTLQKDNDDLSEE